REEGPRSSRPPGPRDRRVEQLKHVLDAECLAAPAQEALQCGADVSQDAASDRIAQTGAVFAVGRRAVAEAIGEAALAQVLAGGSGCAGAERHAVLAQLVRFAGEHGPFFVGHAESS